MPKTIAYRIVSTILMVGVGEISNTWLVGVVYLSTTTFGTQSLNSYILCGSQALMSYNIEGYVVFHSKINGKLETKFEVEDL